MSDNIFLDNCDRYWNAGLPAIPLRPRDKMPAIMSWSRYANQMPDDQEKEMWKMAYADGNIGVPLGPQSGLIAFDVDSEDPRVLGVLDKVLPYSPWKRIGRKGYVAIYKYDGQPTIHIDCMLNPQDDKPTRVVDMLSAGSQVVLPPSIHPTTKQPYYANADLVDVLGDVRSLPPNIEAILRDAFKEVGIEVGTGKLGSLTNFVSPGARDNTMTSIAGLYAFDITRGHKTLLEAIEGMKAWVLEFTGKVYGDNLDPEKGAKKVVEMLIKDVTGPKRKSLPKGWDAGLTDDEKDKMGLGIFKKEHETWSGEEIKDYLDAQLQKPGLAENDAMLLDTIRDVIFKIAGNKSLDPLEEGTLIRYVSDISNRKIGLHDIRRMIVDFRSGEIKGTDHAEIAKAVLHDLNERRGEIRVHNNTIWYFGGSHWKRIEEIEVLKYIADEYGSFKAASRANDHRGILTTMKNMASKELKTREEVGINFVNGFLDEDLNLQAHNPDHGMTYCLEYPYIPEEAGKCSKWLAMLHAYWGKDDDYSDKVNALGEAMAVTMFGKATNVQLAYCLYGVAHSGKSRILEIIQSLMPSEAQTSIPPTMWSDKFGTAPLADKLLNYAGELSEHTNIAADKFKAVIDGSTIEGQFKNQQIFTFRPKAAHWFASNHLPKSRDSSEGFTRRWMFFSFPRKFEGERILDYHKQVVAEERVAIAAWTVQYISRLKTNSWKCTDPPSSVAIREHLENELNSVRSFLWDLQEQGRLLLGVEAHREYKEPVTNFDTLWNEYRSYCVSASVSPVGSKTLTKRMNSLQGTFGFREVKAENDKGFLVTQYQFLTFVTGRAKKST